MDSIRRTLTAAATAVSLLLPALSMAQPDPRRSDDRPSAGAHDRTEPSRRGSPPPRPGAHDPREARDDHDDRGAGPDHGFHRGGRLPTEYRGRQYVVDDWRGHRLSAPPRGYHWVQTGADYVLVAVATGLIAQVLLGN